MYVHLDLASYGYLCQQIDVVSGRAGLISRTAGLASKWVERQCSPWSGL